MKTRDKVLELLQSNSDKYLSGQEIADNLFVTRAAVWKAIKALRQNGIEIDAVTNRGYRIIHKSDVLDEGIIKGELGQLMEAYDLYIYDEVASTNDEALRFARETNKDVVVIADSQTNGRGRRGRNFYSPKGSGIYLSISVRPKRVISHMENITAIAAVSAARAIDDVVFSGKDTIRIKWVNDLFLKEKKVAGILAEAITALENPQDNIIVVGFGINIYDPREGFPKEINKSAGYVFNGDEGDRAGIRSRIIAKIIYYMHEYLQDSSGVYETYTSKSFLQGSYVKINSFDGNYKYARVTGINENFHLLVQYDDDTEDELSSGEVSVVKY